MNFVSCAFYTKHALFHVFIVLAYFLGTLWPRLCMSFVLLSEFDCDEGLSRKPARSNEREDLATENSVGSWLDQDGVWRRWSC